MVIKKIKACFCYPKANTSR